VVGLIADGPASTWQVHICIYPMSSVDCGAILCARSANEARNHRIIVRFPAGYRTTLCRPLDLVATFYVVGLIASGPAKVSNPLVYIDEFC
jgi:hypothetical protein